MHSVVYALDTKLDGPYRAMSGTEVACRKIINFAKGEEVNHEAAWLALYVLNTLAIDIKEFYHRAGLDEEDQAILFNWWSENKDSREFELKKKD